MAHVQKPDFVFRRNERVHLNRQGRQFSRLLAAEVCASAIVMLDTPCSEVVWRVLATHSIRHFPLLFPSRASPYAITFQLDCTGNLEVFSKCKDGGERASEFTFQTLRTAHRPVRANCCGVKPFHESYVYRYVVLLVTKTGTKYRQT